MLSLQCFVNASKLSFSNSLQCPLGEAITVGEDSIAMSENKAPETSHVGLEGQMLNGEELCRDDDTCQEPRLKH